MNEIFGIEPSARYHDRARFEIGSPALDRYFNAALPGPQTALAACFVAISHDHGEIAGYYTKTTTNIPLADFVREAHPCPSKSSYILSTTRPKGLLSMWLPLVRL